LCLLRLHWLLSIRKQEPYCAAPLLIPSLRITPRLSPYLFMTPLQARQIPRAAVYEGVLMRPTFERASAVRGV
jgi:hypothetical protein